MITALDAVLFYCHEDLATMSVTVPDEEDRVRRGAGPLGRCRESGDTASYAACTVGPNHHARVWDPNPTACSPVAELEDRDGG